MYSCSPINCIKPYQTLTYEASITAEKAAAEELLALCRYLDKSTALKPEIVPPGKILGGLTQDGPGSPHASGPGRHQAWKDDRAAMVSWWSHRRLLSLQQPLINSRAAVSQFASGSAYSPLLQQGELQQEMPCLPGSPCMP